MEARNRLPYFVLHAHASRFVLYDSSMIILGIDPGTTSIGYAFIRWENKKPCLLRADLLRLPREHPYALLKNIHLSLQNLIAEWRPNVLAIEKLFFAKNTRTALSVSEVRGVILLTAALARLTISEYTPLEVKKVITSDGRADKIQVKKMLHLTLPETKSLPARLQDDVYDAIAIALTHCFTHTIQGR